NRLRWHYPVGDVMPDGTYRGLPKRIVIERAPVRPKDVYKHPMASTLYPFDWWEPLPDVFMAGFVPPRAYELPKPVQAIRFEYQGSPARIVVRDAANDVVVYDRLVANGESVYVEATLIDTVDIYGLWAKLTDIHVLDLFKNHGLKFEAIA